MAMVEKLVKKAQSRSKGQMSSHFMAQNADSFAIDV
jgi:hypothetical protein